MKLLLPLLAVTTVALSGCTTPATYADGPMVQYDSHTEYHLNDRPGGFALTINYARYQFIPESSAVATACTQTLTSLAHEIGEKRGRTIKPIDEQRVRISLGRNGLTGMTSCSATAPIDWNS